VTLSCRPSTQFHTNSQSDVAGCALAITYQSDEHAVQPEDFAIFTTNRNCVWTRYTDFEVPAAMPECPPGGCICSWFWIHEPDSGSEQVISRCSTTMASPNPYRTELHDTLPLQGHWCDPDGPHHEGAGASPLRR
jgi:hypothetical protein